MDAKTWVALVVGIMVLIGTGLTALAAWKAAIAAAKAAQSSASVAAAAAQSSASVAAAASTFVAVHPDFSTFQQYKRKVYAQLLSSARAVHSSKHAPEAVAAFEDQFDTAFLAAKEYLKKPLLEIHEYIMNPATASATPDQLTQNLHYYAHMMRNDVLIGEEGPEPLPDKPGGLPEA